MILYTPAVITISIRSDHRLRDLKIVEKEGVTPCEPECLVFLRK